MLNTLVCPKCKATLQGADSDAANLILADHDKAEHQPKIPQETLDYIALLEANQKTSEDQAEGKEAEAPEPEKGNGKGKKKGGA